MKALMIVNRMDDWFDLTDVELDECYISIQILERLTTRKKLGLDYDRFKLATILYNRTSSEAINVIDKAIVLLVSRNLVKFDAKKECNRKLLITDLGELTYQRYKEEIKNENI